MEELEALQQSRPVHTTDVSRVCGTGSVPEQQMAVKLNKWKKKNIYIHIYV